jgi:hypothetical protein
MAIDPSGHTESIVLIKPFKKFAQFLPFFAMATKKRQTSSGKLF